MRCSPSALTLVATAIAAALAVVVDGSGQFPGPGAAGVSRGAQSAGSREVIELSYASSDGRMHVLEFFTKQFTRAAVKAAALMEVR